MPEVKRAGGGLNNVTCPILQSHSPNTIAKVSYTSDIHQEDIGNHVGLYIDCKASAVAMAMVGVPSE